MTGKAIHRCRHVLDLQKSLDFCEQAPSMAEFAPQIGVDALSPGMPEGQPEHRNRF